jgi:hypothetical protein
VLPEETIGSILILSHSQIRCYLRRSPGLLTWNVGADGVTNMRNMDPGGGGGGEGNDLLLLVIVLHFFFFFTS